MTSGSMELRVGVLADDAGLSSVNALCLNHLGHYAVPYSSVPSMLDDLERQCFNAFLLDWDVCHETSRNLIAAVRAFDSAVPIVFLTGHDVGSTYICGRRIAAAANDLRFMVVQKPARIPQIAEILQSAMANACREVADLGYPD